MKIFLGLLVMMVCCTGAMATEQIPDHIKYNNEMCELEASWEYPSPLQVYFSNAGKEYPFEMLHTANYRGHEATWELKDNTLYLLGLTIEEKALDLSKFFSESESGGKVKASWFNGIAWVRKDKYKEEYKDGMYSIRYKNYVFLAFKEGVLAKEVVLTEKEYTDLVNEYFNRRETSNPVKEGVIFEFAEYIHSFRK